ncbi:MAG: hypothetical protein ACFFCD_09790 [Promethearchaeota archaeon]
MTTTEISIWLFGKPSHEMAIEGGEATPKMLREKAVELKERLERAAEIFEELARNGWELAECYGSVYDLSFTKDVNETQAKEELKKLGIDPEEVNILELEDEDEFDEFDEEYE